jgi:hypothetical protein
VDGQMPPVIMPESTPNSPTTPATVSWPCKS